MIKIYLRDIGSDGLSVRDQIPIEDIGFTDQEDLKFIRPVDVEAKLSKAGSVLLADGQLNSRYAATCYRCLEAVEQEWEKRFRLDFPIDHSQEFVEIGEDIRQEIILNLPLRELCRKDCRGICHGCGVDLNKEPCRCNH